MERGVQGGDLHQGVSRCGPKERVSCAEKAEIEAVRGPPASCAGGVLQVVLRGVVRLAVALPMEANPSPAPSSTSPRSAATRPLLVSVARRVSTYISTPFVTASSPTRSPRRYPTPPSNAPRRRRSSRWPATPIKRPPRSAVVFRPPSGWPSGSSSFLYLNLTKKDSPPGTSPRILPRMQRGTQKFRREDQPGSRRGWTQGHPRDRRSGSCDLEASIPP